jgi:hypothetical protein
MKRAPLLLALAAATALTAAPAAAACFADYKAKRDDPLRLHYGVMELSDAACGNTQRAEREVADKLDKNDWTLLTVVSTFGEDGLQQRKASAGEYYLRF